MNGVWVFTRGAGPDETLLPLPLRRVWVSRYRLELRQEVLESEENYQDASERLADIRRQQTICILKDAKVIGMTTTGAARLRKVLQEVHPRLVIVEEAAEVLEAHTITTLSRACQHLILIGDHQQVEATHLQGLWCNTVSTSDPSLLGSLT